MNTAIAMLLLRIARVAIVLAQLILIVAFLSWSIKPVSLPALKKIQLAGPLKDKMKIWKDTGKMPEHPEECSTAQPRGKKGRSGRAEGGKGVDIESNGSGNFIPDDDRIRVGSSYQRQREMAGKATRTRSESRMEEYIKMGEGIMNSISSPHVALERFREDMSKLAGKHRGYPSIEVMYGCIARAHSSVEMISEEKIAEECGVGEEKLEDHEHTVGKIFEKLEGKKNKEKRENKEKTDYENKYEKTAVNILKVLGYKKEPLILMVKEEIKERKRERGGKDPKIFCAAIVYNVLNSVGEKIAQREIEQKIGLATVTRRFIP